MKRISLVGLLILFLLLPKWTHAQEEAMRALESLEKKYSGLIDYTVDVTVHFDIESFKTPDMQAKLFYKAPDRMKVESKRVFFFPREGGYFNPSLLKKEDFTVLLLEQFSYHGRKAVKVRLIPRKTKKNAQEFVLAIDTEQNQVREVNVLQFGGREVRAEIEYGAFDRFDLPIRVKLLLDFPAVEPERVKGFGPSGQETKRITGRIDISYSNYKVNSGLSEEIFKERESQKP